MHIGFTVVSRKVTFPERHFPGTVIITLPSEIFITYFSVLNHPLVTDSQSTNAFSLQTAALAGSTQDNRQNVRSTGDILKWWIYSRCT